MRMLLLVILMAWVAGGQELPALKMGVSVNGGVRTALAPGWPLTVNATLVAPDGPATLEVPDEHWSAGLHLTVTDPLGEVVELPLVGRAEGEDTVELKEMESASMAWWLAPEQTEALTPGVYSVRIEFDGRVWAAASFEIGLTDGGSEEDREVTRLLLLSQWAEWEGRFDDALAHAEAILAKQAGSMAARLRMADVLASAGRYREALNALQQAEEWFDSAHGEDAPPPYGIYARRRAVRAKMLGGQ